MAIASRINSSGNYYINGKLDEVKNNPSATGSISFNGTSQYLTIPTNTNYNLGSNNFTIEGWIYLSSLSVANSYSIIQRRNNTPSAVYAPGWWYLFVQNNVINFAAYDYYPTFSTYALISNTALTANTWYHFALVRNGATINLYLNGTSVASVASFTIGSSVYPLIIGADNIEPTSTRWYWGGYISNLRIVNGTAIYTGNFTRPGNPLTAVTNTALLLNTPFISSDAFLDTSTVAATVTKVGTPTSSSVTPFTSTTTNSAVQRLNSNGTLQISGTYDEVTNNPAAMGSLLFDGTSGYITAPDSVNLRLSTGNFTVEGWFYLNALSAVRGLVAKGTGSTGWEVRVTAANVLAASYTATALTGTTTITTNRWHHFALVRSGVASGNIKLYLNGALEATSATAITTDFTQTDVLVVGNSRAVNQFFSGNICNVRILKGTALYTAAFTPPIQPPNAVTNTQFLLNPPNTSVNNILDTSTNSATLTKVGTVTSSPQTPLTLDGFYNYSFNGTADYLTVASNAGFALGTGDFTVECWIHPTAWTNNNGTFIDFRQVGAASQVKPRLFLVSGTLAYMVSNANQITTTLASLNTWYHIALVRSSGSTKLYVNGVQAGSTYTDANDYGSVAQDMVIGQVGDSRAFATGYFTGYISNLRIVNGTAIYTGNFTPPTAPLTAITNTKLLTCRSNKIVDSSSIGATITRTGSVAVNSNTAPFTTYNYAGSGFAVQRVSSNGKFQITGVLDEYTGI